MLADGLMSGIDQLSQGEGSEEGIANISDNIMGGLMGGGGGKKSST